MRRRAQDSLERPPRSALRELARPASERVLTRAIPVSELGQAQGQGEHHLPGAGVRLQRGGADLIQRSPVELGGSGEALTERAHPQLDRREGEDRAQESLLAGVRIHRASLGHRAGGRRQTPFARSRLSPHARGAMLAGCPCPSASNSFARPGWGGCARRSSGVVCGGSSWAWPCSPSWRGWAPWRPAAAAGWSSSWAC